MDTSVMANDSKPFEVLRNLYPTLSDADLKQAEGNLRRYFEVVWEIEKRRSARAQNSGIDSPGPSPTIEERSKVPLTT